MERQTIERNYSIDNFKAVLMVFVILAHIILYLNHGIELSMLYQFIHIFAMPGFIFISGYLAKGIMKNGHFQIARFFSVLWMYVFFQIAWFILEYVFKGDAELDLLTVSSTPWYLLSLAIWYLLVPILISFPKKYVIIITVIVGIFSGYITFFSTFLSLSRVMVYLPFFTMGLLLEKEQMEAFTRKNIRLTACVILFIIVLGFVLLFDKIWVFGSLYYGEYPYVQIMGELAPYGGVVRAITFLLGGIVSICLLAIVPKKKVFFSYVGKNTMAIYILHILIRNVLNYKGFFVWINENYSQRQMLWVIPITIIMTLVLGNPLFGKIFAFISNPFQFARRNSL